MELEHLSAETQATQTDFSIHQEITETTVAQDAAEVERALAKARQVAKKRRRRFAQHIACASLWAILAFGLSASSVGVKALPAVFLILFCGFWLPVMIGLFWYTFVQQKTTQQLAEFEDVRTIGPLLEALELGYSKVTRVIETALLRLLPRLRASDANLLNSKQRRALARLLTTTRKTELQLAILSALEQVGDGSAVSAVKRLANEPGRTPARLRVQQAAQACLLFLEPRVEQEKSSRQLLRASSPTAATPETLLRPAQGVTAQEPEQLLRASGEDAITRI